MGELFDAPCPADVTLQDQIACVQRELAMRKQVYARRVTEGKMSPNTARLEILRMEAVLATLQQRDTVARAPVIKDSYGYTSPAPGHHWMTYCPEQGAEFHKTRQEAEARAATLIKEWFCDGWGEDVDKVLVAQVVARSTQCDRIERPPLDELDENGCDGSGEYWEADWEYKCNYKLMPVLLNSGG